MKAAIVGVTGYTGIELLRIIHGHPQLSVGTIHSYSLHKHTIAEDYPHLRSLTTLPVYPFDPEMIMAENDLVFFATPAGVCKELGQVLVAADFPVIDLSGDLRLKEGAVYEAWYQKEAAPEEMLAKAYYGLPEFLPADTKGNLISNPGCYATAALLAIAPLVKENLVDPTSLILDGKSGLSGAGKTLGESSHYVNVTENMSMYKLNQHQHIPEILQQLQVWNPEMTAIQFTTSLIPVKRGIFLTAYGKVSPQVTQEQLLAAYHKVYAQAPFVRIQPAGTLPQLRQVTGTNFCDIGLGLNEKTGIVTVVGVIDNLMKGASGQAIQNYNRWAGIDETAGLWTMPIYP